MSVTAVFTGGATYSGDECTAGTGYSQSSTNGDAPGDGPFLANLSNGDNTITLPTGHTIYGVSIFPANGNTVVLKLKSTGADAGLPMHLTKASHISLGAAVTTFVINAGSATAVKLGYW